MIDEEISDGLPLEPPQAEAAPKPEVPEQASTLGRFPCPCCGYRTFPVPKEEAVAYICPVCFWENDVFTPSENQPSDENSGMTLKEGQEAFRRLVAVRKNLVHYTRKPPPNEIP